MPRGKHDGPRPGRTGHVPAGRYSSIRLSPAGRMVAARLSTDGDDISDGVRAALRECARERGMMVIDVSHPTLGACVLTTEHPSSNQGQPVLIRAETGEVYGAGDVPPGALSEPLPGIWDDADKDALRRFSAPTLGPIRWDVDI